MYEDYGKCEQTVYCEAECTFSAYDIEVVTEDAYLESDETPLSWVYDRCDFRKDFEMQYFSPFELIKTLKKILEEKKNNGKYVNPRLLESCDLWLGSEVELTVKDE